MRIDASSLSLQSAHSAARQREVQEHLRMWVGARPPSPAATDSATISAAGRSKAAADTSAAAKPDTEALADDPRLQLLIDMVERLTGRRVRLVTARDFQVTAEPVVLDDPHRPAPARDAGFGLEYDYHASYSEAESTRFAAEGVIRTADGREIRFHLELAMQRSYHEETSVSLRLGDAARQTKDPLVINFAGTAAELMATRFAFDLDADGTQEQINHLASGSGFLALDLNRNGQVDDGRELFGARSGDGFADLAAHDADGNGWIDENDPIYAQLKVWRQAVDGSASLTSLASTGVGALSLARVATPFDLKTPGNALLGQVRSSGVYLSEDGRAGTVQQLDLTV